MQIDFDNNTRLCATNFGNSSVLTSVEQRFFFFFCVENLLNYCEDEKLVNYIDPFRRDILIWKKKKKAEEKEKEFWIWNI